MPCKHLPKTDLIHRQEMRPLRKAFFVIYRLPDDLYYPWNHGRTYDLSLDFFQQL